MAIRFDSSEELEKEWLGKAFDTIVKRRLEDESSYTRRHVTGTQVTADWVIFDDLVHGNVMDLEPDQWCYTDVKELPSG